MKKITLSLAGLVVSLLLIVGCNENSEESIEETFSFSDSTTNDSGTYAPTFDTIIVLEKKVVKQLRKRLPAYDKSKFNEVTVEFFFRLAEGTNGRAYFAESASKVEGVVIDILKTHVKEGSDILFLIDNTGSMRDDIEKTKKSVNVIIDALENTKNTRVGMAFYGDKNVDKDWYFKHDLTENYDTLRRILRRVKISGGGDLPESVNDGIYKSIEEYNWRKGHNRIILVLGDAPSLKPPYSHHSEDDVIKLCSKHGVKVNLYPVIIGFGFSKPEKETKKKPATKSTYKKEKKEVVEKFLPEPEEKKPEPVENLEIRVFPNPVKRNCAIEMKEWSKYEIEVVDLGGKRVFTKTIDDYQTRLDFSRQPNGTYVISVYDKEKNSIAREKIIVQR